MLDVSSFVRYMDFMDAQHLLAPFSLAELCYSETALREGIDNTPALLGARQSFEILNNLSKVVKFVLLPLMKEMGIRPFITSGYRCPALNLSVGGVPTSQHVTGQAVDFVLPSANPVTVSRWIAEHLSYDQLLVEQSGTELWIHVSYVDRNKNRLQQKWFDGRGWHLRLPEPEDGLPDWPEAI